MQFDRITIHHTASADRADALDSREIRRWHMEERGWSDIGYHWTVERVEYTQGDDPSDFAAIMGRPMFRTGSHALRANTGNIGVAIVGDFSERDIGPGQLNCTAELVAGLCCALGIRTSQVLAHRDMRDTTCPGRVPMGLLRVMIGELRKGIYPRAQDLPPHFAVEPILRAVTT